MVKVDGQGSWLQKKYLGHINQIFTFIHFRSVIGLCTIDLPQWKGQLSICEDQLYRSICSCHFYISRVGEA